MGTADRGIPGYNHTFTQPPLGTPAPAASPMAPNQPFIPSSDPLIRHQQIVDQYEHELAAQRAREQQLEEIYQDLKEPNATKTTSINYQLSSTASLTGEKIFRSALDQLNAMLEGRKPLDLKRAVFVAENAYFDNQMDYESYAKTIDNMTKHCQMALEQSGFNPADPLAKLMILHKFMADTLTVQVPGQERTATTYPMKYDFEDFWGREDITKQMVSKLMTTTTGQCRSMPLLFLILAEQLGVEAHLALAPEHSYVKFQDKRGNWYNLELTNGHVTTDEFIMQSGYIKAEALRQGLYMRPLSKKEAVAQTLNDLGLYYVHRFSIDDFVGKIAETMDAYAPNALSTAFWQANYRTAAFQHVVKQYQAQGAPQSVVDADTTAMRMLARMYKAYDQVDQMGYEAMPEEAYQRWLNSLDEAAQQNSHRNGLIKINEMLAP